MFKKPFTSKTSAPLRSSDLRKLVSEIADEFHVEPAIAKQLAPDGLVSARALTHVDESVLVYSDKDSNALWLRIDGPKGRESLLVPTVYTLSRVPAGLLPTLETADAVVANLLSGAALFAKGVSRASSSRLPGDLTLGSLVQITAGKPPSVVAVGQLSASKADIQRGEGKAAVTLHARGDYLWREGEEADLPPVTANEGAVSSETPKEAPKENQRAEEPPVQDMSRLTTMDATLTPADVDRLLRQALLQAIAKIQPSSLPIQASSLYSGHVLPNRPANFPPGVEIKKSSYKNLSKWMKALVKEGLVMGKEVKGEWMIMSVAKDHPEVQGLHEFKTVSSAAAGQAGPATASEATDSSAALVVTELFKPSSTVRELLSESDFPAPQGNLYTFADLKKAVASYASKNSLVNPHDQKYIQPDDRLSSVLFKKSEANGSTGGAMSRDDIAARLRDASTKYWTASRGNHSDDDDNVEVRKGSPPVVRIQVKRVGKRDVTLVSHFEEWDVISAKELAEELKLSAASSSSVQPMQGSSPKKPVMEVMVQGSQEQLVKKILTARGVPGKYLEVEKKK